MTVTDSRVLGGRPRGLTALHLDDDELDTRARLVVVGNGMAGARLVEEVLERSGGEQFRITVLGDEPHGNYNRIMLSPVLAGEEGEDDIVLNSHDWYADNGVTLRAGVRAERIDTAAKLVHGSDGSKTPYDHLVLATGSYSFIPPMTGVRREDGELLPGVYGFRTIDETRAMLAAVGSCRRAVVMGGGLLGLEAARALQGHGLQVDLVHAMPWLMNAQLDAEAGAILKRSVEQLGITVHLDVLATEVLGDEHVEGVVLKDGRRLDCDLLVVAAGVRPHSDLALRSGLEVERGIVVDDQLRTDDPDVYAIGECAQHRGQVYGLVAPALRRIADVAEKYEVPMVKVTGGQRIDLLGVRKEDLPAMWDDLGMPSGYAYGKSMRTVKTCVGSDFCRFGLGDSTQLGIDMETRFQGIESPAKIKMAVVGCPRNCAEAYVKDVGVVAIGNGKWEVYVGGAAGASVRKGDLLGTVGSPEEVLTLVGRFVQYYREHANWLERTYDFVPRVGLERIRQVVLEDADGIVADLDANLQRSIDAYRDPWGQDGAEPATPGQFRPSLPLVPLPEVPVR
ncbi:FAD-dependent oxidoreductase [Geodermatophilus marinus]|uniref:FAD-dependent oxidoreductase n=1 Tax=Geodermatophilus sp. LHW52908 TaxID=2303986 RepID=UPI000E3D992D|nr:FAD-dependent oxidoreductase [Geodermatophilus sp. LHW52908]RFU19604.1 NAD(P)/FAD-dependent oxidoreductase [Geodermatophilus sp. LHW52908]